MGQGCALACLEGWLITFISVSLTNPTTLVHLKSCLLRRTGMAEHVCPGWSWKKNVNRCLNSFLSNFSNHKFFQGIWKKKMILMIVIDLQALTLPLNHRTLDISLCYSTPLWQSPCPRLYEIWLFQLYLWEKARYLFFPTDEWMGSTTPCALYFDQHCRLEINIWSQWLMAQIAHKKSSNSLLLVYKSLLIAAEFFWSLRLSHFCWSSSRKIWDVSV